MRVTLRQWNDYWRSREAAISARIGQTYRIAEADRFAIMGAQLLAYSEEVVARDLRPDDLTRYAERNDG